jgi:predicted N-acetyltransferase YhbS
LKRTPEDNAVNTVPAILSAPAFTIEAETPRDVAARDALLDRAMGPRWRRKSSEKLRRGRLPAEGLAFIARDADGRVVGTVRLWNVVAEREISPLEGEMAAQPTEGGASGGTANPAQCAASRHPTRQAAPATLPSRGREGRALLLGPLAVDPALKSAGIGTALMRHAVAEAAGRGHGAVLLVGDAPYYARFGFSAEKTGALAMPGPYEKHRFLALELQAGVLDGARGVLKAAGRMIKAARLQRAA